MMGLSMETVVRKSSDFIPEEVLVKYRRTNEEGWRRILGMTSNLEKSASELSLASDEADDFDPYETSARLPKLRA